MDTFLDADVFNGPLLDVKYVVSMRKVLEFVCQVLINCENQINKYDDPGCGTILATVARSLKEATKDHQLLDVSPCLLLYNVGVELGELSEAKFASGLSLFLIKISDSLVSRGSLTFHNFVSSLDSSVEYLSDLGWRDSMFVEGILPYVTTLSELSTDHGIKECLERAASAAENSAKKSRGISGLNDSGAHAVGVVTRAIYQAIYLTM